jgi:hypothetical protein
VTAFPRGETRPGVDRPKMLQFSVKDDSGLASVHVNLYEGGELVKGSAGLFNGDLTQVKESNNGGALLPATGERLQKGVLFPRALKGPLYFCVWAEDAAGNRSARAPQSDCAWITYVVPVTWVSNGCGGANWNAVLEWAQNYFGNKHTFRDSAYLGVAGTGLSYEVDFKDACDIHDAGYGGYAVDDAINTRSSVDYRRWSQKQVDDQFLKDMRTLCRRKIPATAKYALADCTGGPAWNELGIRHLIGAHTLYSFVHEYGDGFYDGDLTTPGIQKRSPERPERGRLP